MADLLSQAMELADAYARRRAFFASHPFTRAKDERVAEKARDGARAVLEAFLSEHLGNALTCRPGLTHEQMMAGYVVACRFGVLEARAFDLAEQMFKAMNAAVAVIPAAPPECETEGEKTAYAFGYWQGLSAGRAPTQREDRWLHNAVKASSTIVAPGRLASDLDPVDGKKE